VEDGASLRQQPEWEMVQEERQREHFRRVLSGLHRLEEAEKHWGLARGGPAPWERTPEQVQEFQARSEGAHVEALRLATPWAVPPDMQEDRGRARLRELDGQFQARLYNLRAVECGAFTDYWYVPETRGYGYAQRAGAINRANPDATPDERLEAAKRRVAYYKEQAHYLERLVACNLRKGDRFVHMTYADPTMTVERLAEARMTSRNL